MTDMIQPTIRTSQAYTMFSYVNFAVAAVMMTRVPVIGNASAKVSTTSTRPSCNRAGTGGAGSAFADSTVDTHGLSAERNWRHSSGSRTRTYHEAVRHCGRGQETCNERP